MLTVEVQLEGDAEKVFRKLSKKERESLMVEVKDFSEKMITLLYEMRDSEDHPDYRANHYGVAY